MRLDEKWEILGSTNLGNTDGWIFSPPYSAHLRILGGTNKPNETAMMMFIDSFCGCGNWQLSEAFITPAAHFDIHPNP